MSTFFNLVVLFSVIVYFGTKQKEKYLYFLAALFKLIAGITLGIFYYYYFKMGDTLLYYELAQYNASDIEHLFAITFDTEPTLFANQPRARYFTLIVSWVVLFTQGNYWIVSLYFSTFSFLIFWHFYTTASRFFPHYSRSFLLAFLFFPTVVLWSSGILKDTLTNAFVVLLATYILKIYKLNKISILDLFFASICFVFLYLLKFYLFLVLLPIFLYFIFQNSLQKWKFNLKIKVISVVFIIAVTLVMGKIMGPNSNIMKLPKAIERNQRIITSKLEKEKELSILIAPTWSSLLSQLPKAWILGLVGPSFFERGNIFLLLSKIENLIIGIFAMWSLFLIYQEKLFKPNTLLVVTLMYVFFLATFLTLSTPNYGNLIRYKVSYLPFWVLTVSLLPLKNWQNKWLKK